MTHPDSLFQGKKMIKVPPINGPRTMQYTIIIEAKVRPETSDNDFMTMVKANFSGKLQNCIVYEGLKNVD